MTPEQILEECFAAHDAAARAQFERDGSIDVGSCGGAMLGYRGNTKFAKAILAAGRGLQMDGKVYLATKLPEDIRTQHAEVYIQADRAFMAKAREHGIEPAKFWTYVD